MKQIAVIAEGGTSLRLENRYRSNTGGCGPNIMGREVQDKVRKIRRKQADGRSRTGGKQYWQSWTGAKGGRGIIADGVT